MASRIGIMPRWAIAAFLIWAGLAGSAQAEKRVALVIGNSAYQTAPQLPNAAADAKLMSDTLLSLGFFVVGGSARVDLDKAGFDAALHEFAKELTGADVALFYYAGHGVETHGLNYLVPVDAHPKNEADVFEQMTGLAGILDEIERSGTKINLLLLDACRDNPFRGNGVRSESGGLAQMQAPPGTLISFATQPRSVSLDGDDGHSPYTSALAAAMQHPGYGLFRTFNEVGLAVEKTTHGAQLPWVSLSPISGSFYFAGKPEVAPTSPGAPAATAAAPLQEARLTPSNDNLRRDLITDCDRLAAMPFDTGHTSELPGVESEKIDVVAATLACNDAMQRYPDVARFAYEAGRVADARKNLTEARRLYDRAAASGYAMAFNNIGIQYEGDDRSRANSAEAARWYQKAVDAGEPIAMVNLGWMYENGHGVARNCSEAVRLYETAMKAGVPAAMNDLGLLYQQGKCVGRDYAEARHLFEQAIALGVAQAMNNLGTLYNVGDGVPRNKKLARQWFEKAAARGVPQARENLRLMGR